ncbi:MAG: type II toxin-antitoxin system VapC family toxin [Nitrososphaerota archaeon]|nr:type II toxin-antitoxin system VapC family toxin [Nitrososphaerota archaeon]
MGGRRQGGDDRVPQETEPAQHRRPWPQRDQGELGRAEEAHTEGRPLIFIDSSFVIALADEDDQFHRKAVELLPDLEKDQLISDLVLSESVTGVGSRLGYKEGREVFDNLFHSPSVKVVFLSKRLAERSALTYARYGGKLSFADAVSVRMMQDNNVRAIASFDSDFDGVQGVTRLR